MIRDFINFYPLEYWFCLIIIFIFFTQFSSYFKDAYLAWNENQFLQWFWKVDKKAVNNPYNFSNGIVMMINTLLVIIFLISMLFFSK